MKIPVYVDEWLALKRDYAKGLAYISGQLDDWLEANGADFTDEDICDAVLSGAYIYCEPVTAEAAVREYIEQKL